VMLGGVVDAAALAGALVLCVDVDEHGSVDHGDHVFHVLTPFCAFKGHLAGRMNQDWEQGPNEMPLNVRRRFLTLNSEPARNLGGS